MPWDIRPYVGIGSLQFGADKKQVSSIFGPQHPVKVTDPVYDGSENEFRTMDVPVCNYMKGRLHAADTNSSVVDVFFKDLNIYNSDVKTVLRRLEGENGGAKADLGMVIFDKLGIVTSGFFLLDEGRFADLGVDRHDGRGVGVFCRGAYDALLPGFKAISFVAA